MRGEIVRMRELSIGRLILMWPISVESSLTKFEPGNIKLLMNWAYFFSIIGVKKYKPVFFLNSALNVDFIPHKNLVAEWWLVAKSLKKTDKTYIGINNMP